MFEKTTCLIILNLNRCHSELVLTDMKHVCIFYRSSTQLKPFLMEDKDPCIHWELLPWLMTWRHKVRVISSHHCSRSLKILVCSRFSRTRTKSSHSKAKWGNPYMTILDKILSIQMVKISLLIMSHTLLAHLEICIHIRGSNFDVLRRLQIAYPPMTRPPADTWLTIHSYICFTHFWVIGWFWMIFYTIHATVSKIIARCHWML